MISSVCRLKKVSAMGLFLLLFVVSLQLNVASCLLGTSVKYCPGRTIQGSVDKLDSIKDCDVIEGNLILFFMKDAEPKWHNSSLRVKEITGYLILFDNDELTSLDLLFPNLTVIRGSKLYKNYALVIFGMLQLKELRLTSLKSILRGAVNIQMNPSLSSYARKINWDYIARDGVGHNLVESLEDATYCNTTCSNDLCWAFNSCQEICKESCNGGFCVSSEDPSLHGECCHERCLGGCRKPNDDKECFACKNVYDEPFCLDKCGMESYELDGYRCVSDEQCLNLTGRKIYEEGDVKKCVLECPSGYYEDPDSNGKMCRKCKDPCPKTCSGGLIDSISTAQSFQGCVVVEGSLQIRIINAEDIVELEEYLKDIEEIRGFLHVFESNSLTSLEFLKNLRIIWGNSSLDGTYSLIIKDNDNLETIRTNPAKIQIKQGSAAFYRNSKLCPSLMENLLEEKVWQGAYPNKEMRKLVNGYKSYCLMAKSLIVSAIPIRKKGTVKVTLEWDSDEDHDDGRKLVGFQIYYREAKSNKRQSDESSPWSLLEADFISEQDNRLVKFLTNLSPNKSYELYAESLSTDISINNFQSKKINVTTYPFNPGRPGIIKIESMKRSKHEVKIRWRAPTITNGYIDHYVISAEPQKDGSINAGNFCINRTAIETHTKFIKEEEEKQIEEEKTSAKISTCSCQKSSDAYSMIQRRILVAKFADELTIHIFLNIEKKEYDSIRKRRSLLIEEGLPPETVPHLHPHSEMADRGMKHRQNEMLSSIPTSDPEPLKDEHRQMQIDVRSYLKSQPIELQKSVNERFPNGINSSNFPELLTWVKEMEKKYTEESKDENPYPESLLDVTSPIYTSVGGANETTIKEEIITLRNLVEPTYTVKIWACHAQTNDCPEDVSAPCKLCSRIPSTKHIRIIPNESEVKVQSLSLKVLEDKNILVSWKPPLNKRLQVLAYDISLWKENKLVDKYPECQNANLKTEKLLTRLDPGDYSIAVTAFTRVTSIPSQRIPFKIRAEANSGYSLDHIKWMIMILLACIFLIFCYIMRRNKKAKLASSFEYTSNCNYKETRKDCYRYPYEEIDPPYRYTTSDIKIMDIIDKGNFGIIRKGLLRKKNGKEVKVAVKQLKKISENDNTKDLIEEASLMIKFKTYHLVETYGIVTDEIYLIMEYMPWGNLKKYLEKWKEGNLMLPIDNIVKFGIQIADGMSYLESKRVVHRDLAARNCLLDEFENVKVADFGLARSLGNEPYAIVDKQIAERRMPPEYFHRGIFTSESDVWSYGVLLWEIVTNGSRPYNDIGDSYVASYIAKGNNLVKEIPAGTPDFLRRLMVKCWRSKKNQRPSFQELVSEFMDFAANEEFKQIFRTKSHHFMGEITPEVDDSSVLNQETDALMNATEYSFLKFINHLIGSKKTFYCKSSFPFFAFLRESSEADQRQQDQFYV